MIARHFPYNEPQGTTGLRQTNLHPQCARFVSGPETIHRLLHRIHTVVIFRSHNDSSRAAIPHELMPERKTTLDDAWLAGRRGLEDKKAPHHPPWVMESINPGSQVSQERVRRSSLWCELRTVNAVSKIVGRPAQKRDCVYLKETAAAKK